MYTINLSGVSWLVRNFSSGFKFNLITITLTLINRSGCGRVLYANVDRSQLSGRGHVTALDQSGLYVAECLYLYYGC